MTAAHVQPLLFSSLSPHRAAALYTYERVVSPNYSLAPRSPGGGQLAYHPVVVDPLHKNGSLRRGYVNDLYNGIYIQPKVLDLGIVASERRYDVYVWNAAFTEETLMSVTGVPEGMELVCGSLPLSFAPIQEHKWQLIVTTRGPATVEELIYFHFATDDQTLLIIASRLMVWGWPPDWSDGISERLTWVTDVMTSRILAEQRRAVRNLPRRELSASFVVAHRERQVLDTALSAWGGGMWTVPIWPDVQRLAVPVNMGDSFIPCKTEDFDFSEGSLALLVSSPMHYEAVLIAGVAAGGLHTKQPVQQDWPRGVKILPCRNAVLAEMPELTRHTDQLQELLVRFAVLEDCEWPVLVEIPQYRGFPVLEAAPDESEPVTSSQFRLRELFEPPGGQSLYADIAMAGMPVVRWNWLDAGREKKAWLRSVLYALKGRQKAFWVSTYADDMTHIRAAQGTQLPIANIFISNLGGPRTGRKDLRIEMADGRVLYRRILSAAKNNVHEEVLTLDLSLGDVVQVGEIKRISWLTLSRLANDDAMIHHITDEIAKVSLTFQGVRDDDFS